MISRSGLCWTGAGAFLVAGGAAASGYTLSGFDGSALLETLSSLYAQLSLLQTALCAIALFAGVALAGVALEVIITVELLHKVLLAGMAAAPLTFAQVSEPGATGGEGSGNAKAAAAQSNLQIGLYGGGNGVFNADVVLKQPNGTDMTLKDVQWRGEPFDDPPYYGYRATFWPGRSPALGAMLDFTHAKAISKRHLEVEQTGMRDGEAVPPREPVSATFTKLEYSHGLNFLTLNAVYRFQGLSARVLPYIGAGLGVMIPHTELARRGVPRPGWTYRYEISGTGYQALAGVEWRLRPSSRFQPFGEVKLGYARNYTELVEGGSVKSNLFAYQVAAGLSAYVRPPAPTGPAR